jgi:hypothetical protein
MEMQLVYCKVKIKFLDNTAPRNKVVSEISVVLNNELPKLDK